MAKKKNSNYDYIITRARYKAIKAFDHKQMESFCTDVYRSGYEDGRASVPGIDLTAIYEAIGATKGIGTKKLEEIKRSIEAIFDKAGEDKREE